MQLNEVDVYDPDNYVEGVPHEMFATLRSQAPVYWHEHPLEDGFWCVTRHADIVQVNRDWETFSNYERSCFMNTPPEDQLEQTRLMMLNMDPPEHHQLRKLVNRGFTPRRIKELQHVLTDRAQKIVDDIAPKGECEFVEEVAAELPLQAIAEFLGVPQAERRRIFELSNKLIGFDDPEFGEPADREEQSEAAEQMYAFAQELATDRRENPRDDIVTDLLQGEVDGETLSDLDFNLFFLLLAVAGNETTRNAISHSMLALIENPDERQRLIEQPELIDTAIEEFLRWATPVMHFRRTATTDTRIGDVDVAEGDAVVMWHISGNRDEEMFNDPYSFDVGRWPNEHLDHVAFGGGGPHFCLGANLARAEMKVMIEALLHRVPDMELAGEPERLRSNFINGIKRMPVTFTPAH